MELIAKILRIEKTEQISDKFKKRRLIIEHSKNITYPQILEFTLTQNNIALADKLNPGDEVKLLFELKGKEFIDKSGINRVFNSLDVWRIDVIKQSLDFVEISSDDTENTYDDNEPLPF